MEETFSIARRKTREHVPNRNLCGKRELSDLLKFLQRDDDVTFYIRMVVFLNSHLNLKVNIMF